MRAREAAAHPRRSDSAGGAAAVRLRQRTCLHARSRNPLALSIIRLGRRAVYSAGKSPRAVARGRKRCRGLSVSCKKP